MSPLSADSINRESDIFWERACRFAFGNNSSSIVTVSLVLMAVSYTYSTGKYTVSWSMEP
ncbi:MAG: hypothetical protein DMF49_10520 [Acidobacteria bacterium]|nr:MAG: hypothetical protein DMF49_10520 [Acidobacteriota bacterium]